MLPSAQPSALKSAMMFAALVAVVAQGCRNEPTPESRIAAVDDLLSDYADPDGPGASVLIVRDGEILYQHAYGLADVENGTPATTATNYRLASVSKQFTATSVMMLIERGEFGYETPLTELFDGFPAYGADITVAHLLSHTSGLIDYEDLIPDTATIQVKDADVLEMMKVQDSTYFEPGTAYRYSNTAYALLAMAVEQHSGMRYADFLRQNIFDPLEMTGSVAFENGISTVQNRAYGSIWSDSANAYIRRDQSITSAVLGDGGIYSSVEDLYKWDQSLYTEKLLPAAVLAEAWTAQPATEHDDVVDGSGTEYYGYGWYVGNHDGRRYIRHGGSTAGFRNAVLIYPDERLSVWILTNRNAPDIEPLAKRVADVYAD